MVTVLFDIKKPPSSKAVSINLYENRDKIGVFLNTLAPRTLYL